MLGLIRNMIKRAVVTLNPADTGQIPVAQVQWSSSNTANNVQVITPYGFYSVAPTGSLALMFNVMGQEENRAAIFDNPKGRFKNLKPGESVVGNPLTGSKVYFKENGDIEVTGVADQNINITGDVNLTVGGNVNITATGNTNITSPVVTVDGALNVTGDITAFSTGTSIAMSDIKTTYQTHTHDENDNAPAPTDAPNQLIP